MISQAQKKPNNHFPSLQTLLKINPPLSPPPSTNPFSKTNLPSPTPFSLNCNLNEANTYSTKSQVERKRDQKFEEKQENHKPKGECKGCHFQYNP